MNELAQDLRYALRALSKRPFYAAVTILVLALAIGANTTVFSVFNGFFLKAMPYPDGDRLVAVYDSYPKIGIDNAGISIPAYLERRAQASSLEELGLITSAPRTLTGDGPPQRILVSRASPSLFSVLRVAPAFGRVFTDDEATVGNDRVVLLSDELWRTRFGAATDIVGQDVRIDGEPFRVLGVMPERFGFPNGDVAAWVPFAYTAEQASNARRDTQFSAAFGRLRPGATVETLNAELDAIMRRAVDAGLVAQTDIDVAGYAGRAQGVREQRVGVFKPMLLVLQAMVAAVLLIACANLANFQLARVATRRKELAVRTALGAGGGRLVRLVLVESAVLALGGAIGGLWLALGGLKLVRALGLDRASDGFAFELDATVLTFTLGAAAVAALGAGLPPVLALLRDDVMRAVREAGRQGAGGRSTQTLRGALVVTQLGISLTLLVAAGLLGKSFHRLQEQGPGFTSANVWTARIALPTGRYQEPETWARFQQRALDELRALPGVVDAGFTSNLPFSGDNDQGSFVIDAPIERADSPSPHAQHRSVDDGYFRALGIPIVMGRTFGSAEPDPVAIVDENVAAKFWPNGDALGQRVRHNVDTTGRWYTIVGVVQAVKEGTLAADPTKETIYWHYTQRPQPAGGLVLRTTLDPQALTRLAADAIARLDPELALFGAMSMDARVLRSLGPQRTPMVLTLIFAAVAVALAVIGIYAVLTWAATQRRAEIGIRIAVGARAADIVRMFLRQAAGFLAIGLPLGVAGALVLGQLLRSQIRDVSATDPAVFAVALTAISLAALLASWLPARRAARIDPLNALREE